MSRDNKCPFVPTTGSNIGKVCGKSCKGEMCYEHLRTIKRKQDRKEKREKEEKKVEKKEEKKKEKKKEKKVESDEEKLEFMLEYLNTIKNPSSVCISLLKKIKSKCEEILVEEAIREEEEREEKEEEEEKKRKEKWDKEQEEIRKRIKKEIKERERHMEKMRDLLEKKFKNFEDEFKMKFEFYKDENGIKNINIEGQDYPNEENAGSFTTFIVPVEKLLKGKRIFYPLELKYCIKNFFMGIMIELDDDNKPTICRYTLLDIDEIQDGDIFDLISDGEMYEF